MLKLKTKHVLTGAEFSVTELSELIECASQLKKERDQANASHLLQNKHLAILFEKPSLRTRFSFVVAMKELGGDFVESVSSTRKDETPEDQMRVLQGYCHAVMIRTHEDITLNRMKEVATIPIINGLSDHYHPCQILADLLTLKEKFSTLNDLHLCYIGDGNNILHSLLLMAPPLGIHLHYCCPPGHGPNAMILTQAKRYAWSWLIQDYKYPKEAVRGCHAVYTDVWNSMGFPEKDQSIFNGFQVNEELMTHADDNAVFMHCMPMERGKEVSDTLPDSKRSVIFQQSENRLHVQKALLIGLLGEEKL